MQTNAVLMHSGFFFRIFLFITIVSLLLDWYVFSGLKTFTAGWHSRRLRLGVLWGYLTVSIGVILVFFLGIGSFSTARGMRPFHEWVLSLFLVLFISKLIFCIILFVGDLGRFFYGIGDNLIHKRKKGDPFFPARRKFISDIAVAAASVSVGGFLYGMTRGKYDFRLHRETFYFDDLPEAFDGFTITQVSDIHSGSFDNDEGVRKGIELAKAQKSDLFVFTGDLVNNAAWEIEPYIEQFRQLKAPHGQFSILGNHDYGDYVHWDTPEAKAANLEKVKQQHQKLEYRLLLNENAEIEKNGQKISLIGVQNWGRGFIQLGDLDQALQGVGKDAFKILLSHDPTHWEEKVRYHPTKIHLTLAGHTHGAQFGVETAGLRWSPVQYRYLDWAGPMEQNGRHLYVNRGFGFLAFSGRLGIWPEVTVITLKRRALS